MKYGERRDWSISRPMCGGGESLATAQSSHGFAVQVGAGSGPHLGQLPVVEPAVVGRAVKGNADVWWGLAPCELGSDVDRVLLLLSLTLR